MKKLIAVIAIIAILTVGGGVAGAADFSNAADDDNSFSIMQRPIVMDP